VEDAWHPTLRFLLAALAVWRLSFLVAREPGPWNIFSRVRGALAQGSVGSIASCVKCLSLWIAIPFVPFVTRAPVRGFVVWLALSGTASLVDEWTRPAFQWKEGSDDELLRGSTDGGAA